MFLTGQIKIPGKGVGLETLRWMTEAWSCMNTAQKYVSPCHQHLRLGLQEFSKSGLNLRSINLHMVNISFRIFSGLLYWIEKSQEFYTYPLAYAGMVLFLSLLPLLHPVAQNFLRETNCFFLLSLNICIFRFFSSMFIVK